MNMTPESIPEVDASTAYEGVESGNGVVLDVREPEELRQVAVNGALHVPLGELHNRLDAIPRDTNVYVLCHVGQRSAMATEFLHSLGRQNVWNIRGGIIAWLRAGLPAEWSTSR